MPDRSRIKTGVYYLPLYFKLYTENSYLSRESIMVFPVLWEKMAEISLVKNFKLIFRQNRTAEFKFLLEKYNIFR